MAESKKPVTKALPTDPMLEIGASGLEHTGGIIENDFLTQLQGRKAEAIFREMSENHAVIGAVLLSIEMLFRSVDWSVEPSDSDDQQAIDQAEFVAGCMDDMSTSWSEVISSTLVMLAQGYSYHEVVYKRRNGWSDDGTRSRYSDGRYGWRKMPARAHGTLVEWAFDDNGGILGVQQRDQTSGRDVFLPIDKCLLFRTTTRLNNPLGRSILRSAYVSWYYQKRITEIEAIGVERDLAGLPVALVPPELLSATATSEQKAALDAIKNIVTNVRRDEQEGIVYPLAYNADGQLAYDLKLLTTGGSRQLDTDAIIGRYDSRIAMSMLADFILLGHENVGTQALSVSKIELFEDAIDAWLQLIADVFNQHELPRLLQLNGINPLLCPKIMYSSARTPNLEQLMGFVEGAVSSGAIIPDDELDRYLRGVASLPIAENTEVS
jgi:hypothetical protein